MNKISIQAIKRLNDLFQKTLQSSWRSIILSIITFLTLLLMDYRPLYSSWSFLPSMHVLLANGVFFTFGWLLYDHKYLLHSFKTNALKQILFSFILFPVYLYSLHELNGSSIEENDMLHFPSVFIAALIIWLMIFGITGLFVRIIRQPVPCFRYASNASYWIYLIHLPIVLLIVGLLSDINLPAIIKFLIVVVSTTIITLVTYHFFVISTLIGLFISGRKYT